MSKTNKTVEQRESILEDVESAMLRGAYRQIDIMRVVPAIRRHDSAKKYMEAVQSRWSGRTDDNEANRVRLIGEARQVIQNTWRELDLMGSSWPDRARYYMIILKAQERISKLLGLEVRKVDVSSNTDMLEKREETIALLTASAEAHSVRSILRSIGPKGQGWEDELSPQRIEVELSSGEERASE